MTIVFQLISVITLVGSGIYLFAGGSAEIQERIPLFLVGLVATIIFLAIGEAFQQLSDIRSHTKRSADALEQLANRRAQQK